jgi:hypothetical protein
LAAVRLLYGPPAADPADPAAVVVVVVVVVVALVGDDDAILVVVVVVVVVAVVVVSVSAGVVGGGGGGGGGVILLTAATRLGGDCRIERFDHDYVISIHLPTRYYYHCLAAYILPVWVVAMQCRLSLSLSATINTLGGRAG